MDLNLKRFVQRTASPLISRRVRALCAHITDQPPTASASRTLTFQTLSGEASPSGDGAVVYQYATASAGNASSKPVSGIEGVGIIRLNRPEKRNCMSSELLDAFRAAVQQSARDAALRVLVVAGSGGFFSAGADLGSDKFGWKDGDADSGSRQLTPAERSYAMYEPFLSLLDCPVPTIGALTGPAVGGGFGLALLCDMRIAAAQAKYGANFSRLGIHPGMGISYTLPLLIGAPRASELLYTGRLITGQEAADMGLVNRAVAGEEVLASALELAREVAGSAPIAVQLTKRTMAREHAHAIRARAWQEAALQAATLETRDAKEGVAALLQKRKPVFTGS